jgi:putative transposase
MLRRYYIENADYFVTVVTYRRERLLLRDVQLFWDSWHAQKPKAWVILPDHFHVIVNVGESDITSIVRDFKIRYSRRFRDRYRPGRVWQRRFWDHVIRNQEDMNRHLDYIHYNPVKHGITNDPFEHQHSSPAEFANRGFYERDWGSVDDVELQGEFGE